MYSSDDLAGRVVVEVGVDAVGVGLQAARVSGLQQRQLLLGDPAPAHRADELVDLEGVLAEHLRRAGPAVMCRRTSISKKRSCACTYPWAQHQVVGGVGVQLRDAVVVAHHRRPSPSSPGTSTSPSVCGNGRRTSTTPATRPATSSSTSADRDARRPTSDGPAASRQERRCQRERTRSRCGDGAAGSGSVMVACALCRTIGSRPAASASHSPGADPDHPRRTVPTYQYACTECGHAFEQFQSFTDDALTVCPECEGRLRKVFNAVGVVFKGSGFYRNDSRAEARRRPSPASDGELGRARRTRRPARREDVVQRRRSRAGRRRAARRPPRRRPPAPAAAWHGALWRAAARACVRARLRSAPCPRSAPHRLARLDAPSAARCCAAAGRSPRCWPPSRSPPGCTPRVPRRPTRSPCSRRRPRPRGRHGRCAPTTWPSVDYAAGHASPTGLAADAGRAHAGRARAARRAGHRRPAGRRRRWPRLPRPGRAPGPAAGRRHGRLLRVGDRIDLVAADPQGVPAPRGGRRRPGPRAAAGPTRRRRRGGRCRGAWSCVGGQPGEVARRSPTPR